MQDHFISRPQQAATNNSTTICIQEIFKNQAEQTPNNIAVTHNDYSLSYAELHIKSNQLADYLIQKGVGTGVLVGICIERSIDMAICVLAVLKAGGAYLPLDPRYPKKRLLFMISDSRCQIILTQSQIKEIFSGIACAMYCVDTDMVDIGKRRAITPTVNTGSNDDLAYCIYTSGSTGNPKGVAMCHKPLVNLIKWQLKNSLQGPQSRTLQFAPLSFDVSFQEMFSTWCSGGTLMMIDDELRLDAFQLLRFIQENTINRLFLPFIALYHLAETAVSNNLLPESLQEIITAGEQLQINSSLVTFFSEMRNCSLHNQYGPSETHVVSAYELTGDPTKWPVLPPIGRPIDNTQLYILDEQMLPQGIGQPGELFIGGVGLARGYLFNKTVTDKKFIQNPFVANTKDRLYRTGDLAQYNQDGDIEFLGRIDDQVKVRGYRIELGEVEVAIGKHPNILQAVVSVKEINPGEKILIAYIIYKPKQHLGPDELRHYLKQDLPDYMVPSSFVEVETFPRTPSGKIDRSGLPDPVQTRPKLSEAFSAPESEIEKLIAETWSRILSIENIGTNDNFFDLGGTSITATLVISELRKILKKNIPVFRLFQHPTVRRLATHLRAGTNNDSFHSSLNRNRKIARANFTGLAGSEPVAVIGMACRLPGAESPDEFWSNLCQGKDSITFFSKSELKDSVPPDLLNKENYIRARGIISHPDRFDAAFFGMSASEATMMDPQQRILLETSWSALEDASVVPDKCDGLIGVYAGKSNNTYYQHNLASDPERIDRFGDFQTMLLNEKDYLATHIAHKLNLSGPAISINTACSTSLVAIGQAFFGLKTFQCDIALAGGVTITSPVKSGYIYQEGGIYSADGRTRPFDEKAEGTVFSDGAGMVVLKRLTDAVKDGDRIYAIIKGAGLNNDGSDKASFGAPSVNGQAAAIATALNSGNIAPSSISYVETHGTATPLGDPIEIEGLKKGFQVGQSIQKSCAIGSAKGNIGHLNAASGVTGFIKTALCLHHKLLPPTLYFNKENPEIDLENSPFYVNTTLKPWEGSPKPRRAGVSSFGVGGTNAHLILEEAPEQSPAAPSNKERLILLSAQSENKLGKQIANLKQFFITHPNCNLADASFTLQTGRKVFNHRYYATCSSNKDAISKLQEKSTKCTKALIASKKKSDVAFVFPGQGVQHVYMGQSLYKQEPVFRSTIDFCSEFLQPLLQLDLREILYNDSNVNESEKILRNTSYTQPALFMVELAMAHQWLHWGIAPGAMAGHSIGEYVAACLADVFSVKDALSLVASRGRIIQNLPSGNMLSVRLPEKQVLPFIDGTLSIAAINSPSNCVVSGPGEDIDALEKELTEKGVSSRLLHTSHAFHSSMMDPAVIPFKQLVQQTQLSKPTIPFVSTVTGKWITPDEATSPDYWANHLRATVRFSDAIHLLWENTDRILLEVGPRSTSTTLARQHVDIERKNSAISTMGDSPEKEAETVLSAIGQLWLHGIDINWKNYYDQENRHHLTLPTYPFMGDRYWVETRGNTFQTDNSNQSHIHSISDTTTTTTTHPKKIDMRDERQQDITHSLKNLFEELSGEDLTNISEDVTFIEMGFDSLLLTQASLQINKTFNIEIKFRQLMEELSTLTLLADHLVKIIPAEDFTPPVKVERNEAKIQNTIENEITLTPPPTNTTCLTSSEHMSAVEEVVNKQLEIMADQLQLLRGSSTLPQPSDTNSLSAKSDTHQRQHPVSDTITESTKKSFGPAARIARKNKQAMSPQMAKSFAEFSHNYTQKTSTSKQRTQETRDILADPRVVSGFRPEFKEVTYPILVNKSKGSTLWDIDGNTYIDLTCGFGSNLLGYSPDFVNDAITEQLSKGMEIGPQHPLAAEVAQLLLEFTNLDRIAFCNTGSEAVLGALRVARTITGKSLIAIFKGAYHGIFDEVIVRSGKNHKSIPAAPGIANSMVENVIVLDYDDQESLTYIKEHSDELAAVLVEPVQSRNPDLQPKDFLHQLREITAASETALIFDEVITGFRIHPGGAQAHFGIQADIATYGKVIGGGLPIGVIAGNKKFMDGLDGGTWQYGDASIPEVGVTYFAGTFVRHPLALATAKAVLLHLKAAGPSLQQELNATTDRFREELNNHFNQNSLPLKISNFGSLFKITITEDLDYGELLFTWLRYKGLHIWDARPCFFTTAHTDKDIKNVIEAIKQTVHEMQTASFFPATTTKASTELASNENDINVPPVKGARLGKDKEGNPAWYIADPDRPGKYLQLEKAENRGE